MPATHEAPIQALLYDLDGTLIDSMPLHHESWADWHAQVGLPFEEAGFFAATAGRTNLEILRDMLPQSDEATLQAHADLKEALYRQAAQARLQLVPGTAAVLERARALGLAQAVCTAAPPENIEVAYRRFDLGAWMATTVSPSQGFRGKPHPDLFLEAARRLGVPPEACVVFEDAPLGVEAARRAGMRAVALCTTMPAEAFAGFDNLLHSRTDFSGSDPATLPGVRPGPHPTEPKEARHA